MWWKELLFTAFYSGYFPKAPGTAGTVVALTLYLAEYAVFGNVSWMVNCAVVLCGVYPAIKLGDAAEKYYGTKDPQEVVLDEVLGYWITVLFYPFSWKIAVTAFFLFRLYDVIKPFPARKLQELTGGLGIMIDDYIAGIYANLTLLLLIFLSGFTSFSFF